MSTPQATLPAAPVTADQAIQEPEIPKPDPTACKYCKRPSHCQECNHELVPEPPKGPTNLDQPRPDIYKQLPPPLALTQHPDFKVQSPPAAPDHGKFSVFAAGSIEMGYAIQWQKLLANHLCDMPISICNPRRGEWDSKITQQAKNSPFREQVEWELAALTASTVICFFFDHATMSPVSLMELGLWAHSGKVVVCCNQEYWKGGNVHLVCERYGVPLVKSFKEMVPLVRAMLRVKGLVVDKKGALTEREEERDPERSMGLEEAKALLKANTPELQGMAIDRENLGVAK
ncbi:hypothetical protein P171DRAFT_418955 [Karstenula rhodostoma CBS 690.94]|uniref:Uncharacterized protein n=1 Tax=Karstenula rhodostoma CBS 690.94 TaxID=1392251 RepID=A0A9P4PBE3_9PLEO|nr:hypothetical protein P171DRAFT_418955 [Karstenula rhodostoma CBS 690.94]